MTAAAKTGSPVMRPAAAYMLLGVLGLVWGFNWPVMKIGLEFAPPFWFGTIRLVLAAAVLFAVLALRGELIVPSRADWPVVASGGLFVLGLWLAAVQLGLVFVPAGRAALLAFTTPLWVVPLAMMFLGERMTWLKAAGLGAGFAGLGALFNPLALDWSDRNILLGNAALLLSALSWALGIVHLRRHRYRATTLQLAPWQILIAIVPVGLPALYFETWSTIRWGGEFAGVLAYSACLATSAGFWAMTSISRALPAITTSLASLVIPAVGIAASALTLGEPLTTSLLGGLLLIALGVAGVALADAHSRNRAGR